MQPRAQRPEKQIPIQMVGGNKYGRFPKMSDEQTINMVVADGWMVPYAGYKKIINISNRNITGRGLFTSTRGGFMISVIGNIVYKIQGPQDDLFEQRLFTINTFTGDVAIDENNANQIAIADGQALWIYNWLDGSFQAANLPINEETGVSIKPGYVTFHNTYFIVPDLSSDNWYLSESNNGLSWEWGAGDVPVNGAIQTKPDNCVAVLRAPGKGGLIYVFGANVTELYNSSPTQTFPYSRNNSTSIDFGCISPNTIAAMDNMVVFLGVNERSGPVIVSVDGANERKISTDGIDYKLEQLQYPGQSYASFYTEAGHVYYQITFYNPADNLTLVYDFNEELFYTLTDENLNHHIAARIAYFNDTYYFVSINDASLYELSYKYTNYDYTLPSKLKPNPNLSIVKTIPRGRVPPPLRRDDSSRFVGTNLSFTMEQGADPYYDGDWGFYITTEDGAFITEESPPGYIGNIMIGEKVVPDYVPRIDLRVSRNGAESFTGNQNINLNAIGLGKNRILFNQLGEANDLVCKFMFWSLGRVVFTNGFLNVRENEVGPEGLR